MPAISSPDSFRRDPLDPTATTGLILVGMGGPDGPDAVEPFLRNLFADPAVLPLPPLLAKLVGWLIVKRRARGVRERYARIGHDGGSPQLDWTRRQSQRLAAQLQHRGLRVAAEPAMRNWHPYPSESVARLLDQGATQFLVVPAYPQYATATSGTVLAATEAAIHDQAPQAAIHCLSGWHLLPGYLHALVRRAAPVLRRWVEADFPAETCALLTVAHSLPERFIRQGDPYLGQTEATVAALSEKLAMQFVDRKTWWRRLPGGGEPLLAFQSKVGPMRWLGPDVVAETKQLAEAGCRRLLVLPVSFTCEHIETLYELDIELAETARAAGITEYVRGSALNLDPVWIETLAHRLISAAFSATKSDHQPVVPQQGQATGSRSLAPRVAIIGGGVAGLATACQLEQQARHTDLPLTVTVFERDHEVGGKLRTVRQDGFTLETGPNGWLDNEPATRRLLDRLELTAEVQTSEAAARRRYLQLNGRLRELPLNPRSFLASDILTWPAKLRVAAEFLVPARKNLDRAGLTLAEDETVFAFGERRLGRQFAERLLDPMVKGIFGGDARQLSLAAAFPRMVELERDHGGLFRALWTISRQRRRQAGTDHIGHNPPASVAGPGAALQSLRRGMGQLPARIRTALTGELYTGSAVEKVWRENQQWWVQTAGQRHGPFDMVVDASPAHAACGHLDDPELIRLLTDIPYVPMVVATLAFDRDAVGRPLDGFGMLNPSLEQRPLLGVLWTTSIFKGRAPSDKIVLRCMLGGREQPAWIEASDEQIVATCLAELGPLHDLRTEPSRVWIFRHERAIAQYDVGHLARLEAVDRCLARHPGLYLTGSSYRGVSVNHCLAAAETTAAAVLAELLPGTVAANYAAGCSKIGSRISSDALAISTS
ncbi:MAG: protoporphyrinogen oxidase [bacterium]